MMRSQFKTLLMEDMASAPLGIDLAAAGIRRQIHHNLATLGDDAALDDISRSLSAFADPFLLSPADSLENASRV